MRTCSWHGRPFKRSSIAVARWLMNGLMGGSQSIGQSAPKFPSVYWPNLTANERYWAPCASGHMQFDMAINSGCPEELPTSHLANNSRNDRE